MQIGDTALIYAVIRGDLEIVRLLINNGCDGNAIAKVIYMYQ
jgi:hypothetical protein